MAWPEIPEYIHWVKQEDPNGCSIACCAMMCQCTYQEAKEFFIVEYPEAGVKPVGAFRVQEFLKLNGWEYTKYANKYRWSLEGTPDVWPCPPLDEVNFCSVQAGPDPNKGHSVLMFMDGSVLDPLHNGVTSLQDYVYVNSISGWRRKEDNGNQETNDTITPS